MAAAAVAAPAATFPRSFEDYLQKVPQDLWAKMALGAVVSATLALTLAAPPLALVSSVAMSALASLIDAAIRPLIRPLFPDNIAWCGAIVNILLAITVAKNLVSLAFPAQSLLRHFTPLHLLLGCVLNFQINPNFYGENRTWLFIA